MHDYDAFLNSKSQVGTAHGFEPTWFPDSMMDFQRSLSEWEIRRGRGATFADCGMGKSILCLTKCENVVRHTNGRALILTPLSVAPQFVTEGEKFGVQVTHCRDGKVKGSGVYVTNYERLHLFDKNDFVMVGCDESGCLKDFESKRKDEVTEFMRTIPYRNLYTATAAPNDYDELGTSAESLGELGYQDMVSKFFKKETTKDYLGWGRMKYKLRAYAERGFWQWVCSWARACRKPSDLGFEDGDFKLPPLVCKEHNVAARRAPAGSLFDSGARTLQDQREEQRRTLEERCEKVAELVKGRQRSIAWVNLNDEGNWLRKNIPNSREVSGATSEEEREEIVKWFTAKMTKNDAPRILVSKPSLFGFGLNLQCCSHMTFFPSHSFERYYQSVRRCWRFGQMVQVDVDVVTTDGAAGVLANLQRKQDQAEEMFKQLVELMNESIRINRGSYGNQKAQVPSWL